MAGLLDFLQAASNTAASNVSGPVDGLAWLLRKAGVPVNNPMLGSAWMEQQGLTKPVRQSAASLAGETMALSAPIAMAAKAPQIAAGLLTAQDKAAQGAMAVGRQGADMAGDYMARSGLAPQATAWHGSPHKFDKFDSSKIGTGEGAQAYGHGLYLAESDNVANQYATGLTSRAGAQFAPEVSLKDKMWLSNEMRKAGEKIGQSMDSPEAVYTAINHVAGAPLAYNNQGGKYALEMFAENLSPEAKAFIKKNVTPPTGNLYKVDLPDETIARMLDWDKPLSQQAPAVRDAVAKVMEKRAAAAEAERLAMNAQYPARTTHPVLGKIANKPRTAFDYKGEAAVTELVKELGGPDKAAAYFRAQGIPGIRYLDGGSRTAGQGTSNYVVFPGEEGLLKILERNGQALP